jgi:hypothetical protein
MEDSRGSALRTRPVFEYALLRQDLEIWDAANDLIPNKRKE